METIDVRGLSCPSPVLEVKQAIDKGVKTLRLYLIVGHQQKISLDLLKMQIIALR